MLIPSEKIRKGKWVYIFLKCPEFHVTNIERNVRNAMETVNGCEPMNYIYVKNFYNYF